MEQADNNPSDPVQDQLDLEWEDERAIRPFEQAELDRELERAHYEAEWEARHDYEQPDSAVAYDYLQHTAPTALPQAQTVSGTAVPQTGYKFKWIVDVKHETVPWLWEKRIPFGSLTILDGDPGIGKTTIVLDLMARLSVGKPMPFSDVPLQELNSLVVSVEDSIAFTIAPRLRAAGADEQKIAVLIDFPLFPSGLDKLKKTVKETRARLVMVDPGLAMFDVGINATQDAETRRVVGGLAALAADCEAAVVFVRHLTKGQRDQAMYRGGGSIAISAAARSCMLAKFPRRKAENPVLASYKSSLSLIPPTLTYRIVGDASGISHIEWLEEIAMTADEALEGDLPQQFGGGGERPAGASAGLKKQLLRALKLSGGEGATASELQKVVKRGRGTVQEALDELVGEALAKFEEEKKGKGRPRGVYRLGDGPLNDEGGEGPQERFDD